jgi:hypothetical protein
MQHAMHAQLIARQKDSLTAEWRAAVARCDVEKEENEEREMKEVLSSFVQKMRQARTMKQNGDVLTTHEEVSQSMTARARTRLLYMARRVDALVSRLYKERYADPTEPLTKFCREDAFSIMNYDELEEELDRIRREEMDILDEESGKLKTLRIFDQLNRTVLQRNE